MHVYWRAIFRRDPKYVDDLVMRCGRGVVDAHPDRQRPTPQPLLYVLLDLGQFFRRGFTVSGISAWKKRARVAHHPDTHRNVPDAHTEIDQRLSFALRIPAIDVLGSDLQLQRCSDAVVGLKLIVARLLSMLVQVNESRRYHEAFGVY